MFTYLILFQFLFYFNSFLTFLQWLFDTILGDKLLSLSVI
jgi:hypothetical protein